ncbi:MAG: hypothetical protein JWP87_3064 [Labilithrix sp.]|nr:hypothetical protein [Labilithrix sp.]
MAEEKKPKIDLKARLGKGAGGATPPPPTAGIPVPAVPAASGSSGGAGMSSVPQSSPSGGSGGLPMPPGIPVGPPPAFGQAFGKGSAALDPSNPLAAAATPYRAPTPPPPPQPQRIEVDEMAVQEARKGARKQGLIAGLVAAVVLGAIGFIAGGATETNKGRQKSVGDAKSLGADVAKSRDQLKTIADKVEAGKNSLLKDKKFPDGLAKELGGINVDFDGNKLAGVRFSGFPQETTSTLIEYITQVQTLNDRKTAIIGLLQRLQKPITEQLTAGQKTNINYVVLFGKQDPSRNPFALLAPLTKPIEAANPTAIALPAEFTATDPLTRQNITAPKYTTGNLDKPSAVYVLPKSLEAACPSETAGSIAQLGSQLSRVLTDIRGEQAAPGGDVVTESKPGLIDRAEKLVTSLNRVQ